jgi:predicted ATPase
MLGSLIKASLLVEGGQSELGLLQFDRVYRAYRQSGARIGEPWLLALHGEMLAKAGQYDRGLLALEEALACVEETGERYHEAEIHRLKGEFLLLQSKAGAAGAAEACFLTSLELARTKQAKMLELRAATSLAKLYTDKGREKEAFDALGTVYAWFDEGLESRELKDVSDLLIRLSGLL